LDLHGELFGIPIRIHPLFWPVTAALGWAFYADPDHGGLSYLLLWMLCVLLTLLLHELAHVVIGRLFSVKLGIVLGPLGGWSSGMESLPRRGQRVLVRVAGPLAQALLLAAIWALTSEDVAIPAFLREQPSLMQLLENALRMLVRINLTWLVLNFLPLWPLDGGYILRDLCEALFGPRGAAVALGACLAGPILLGVWIGQQAQPLLGYLYDPRKSVQLQMGGILLLFCVLLFLSAFRALRDDYRLWRTREATARQSGATVPHGSDEPVA
jgi:Zn-dependent protease